jgi:hypothetical protein
VLENKVLKRIFGYKREEGAGGLRKLHNEKLLRMIWTEHAWGR